jgi:hypothetical protein
VPGCRQYKALNHKVRKIGRRKREEDSNHGRERKLVLQENNNLCDGEVFLLDRSLLLFLNSCEGPRRLKAASLLDHYLENLKKVVPQNWHFIIDM